MSCEVESVAKKLRGFVEVDNVTFESATEEERSHMRIADDAFMAKMYSGIE